MLTCPIPPGIYPTMSLQNLKIRSATDVRFITSAVRINSGIATRAKLLSPVNILVPMMASPIPLFNAYIKEDMIMAAAIGIPNTKNAMKLTKNNAMLDIYLSSSLMCPHEALGIHYHITQNMIAHKPKTNRQDCIHIF